MEKLKEVIRKMIEQEDKAEAVEISANSLEQCLEIGASRLGLPVSELEYEIVEKGSSGLLGLGKKSFKLLIYQSTSVSNIFQPKGRGGFGEKFDMFDNVMEAEEADKDSEVIVKITHRGVLLKITTPKGKGSRISESKVLEKLLSRGAQRFDKALVAKLVKKGTNDEYVRIGDSPLNVANDSTVDIDTSDDRMKAYLMITAPKPGGADLEFEEIIEILNHNGIKYGINKNYLKDLIDHPIYNETLLIAEGKKPEYGKDAEIHYNFKTSHDQIELKEIDGRVDFKELNLIENVVAGQIVATKENATLGEEGRTVYNELIPSKPGKDTQIGIGKNVKLSDDGMTAIAEINGQVVLLNQKINIEPIYEIDGNVDIHTGNVLFLGTVIIKGNVEDGFSVKAAGNIEVKGSVGKCELDAEGDIIIKQGVMGKMEGRIISGGSVYAKFIEHVTVEAKQDIFVTDGILHSEVDAEKKIICNGKRATIVGGRLRAGEEIDTKELGSVAGTETIMEAGIDPKKRQLMMELEQAREQYYQEKERISTDIKTLMNQKKLLKDKFPKEKQEVLVKLSGQLKELTKNIEDTEVQIEEINQYLITLKTVGKISVSKTVYPGVKIYIKNAFYNANTEFKNVSFIQQLGEIKVVPYSGINLKEKK